MELKYKAIACFLIGIFSLSGCTSTFDDLNTNPDTTTKVNASMLASKVILDMTKSASNWRNEFLVKRMFWGEQIDDGQYNRFGKGSFDNIQTLTNAWKMVELSSEDDLDAHTGLYYFLKGWYFYRTTMDMGDIPYSEALNIEEHRYPQYDEQKDVFKGILEDLALADEYFAFFFLAKAYLPNFSTEIIIPIAHISVNLGWFYPVFVYFMFTAESNAVNLTDGLDGLATGLMIIA